MHNIELRDKRTEEEKREVRRELLKELREKGQIKDVFVEGKMQTIRCLVIPIKVIEDMEKNG